MQTLRILIKFRALYMRKFLSIFACWKFILIHEIIDRFERMAWTDTDVSITLSSCSPSNTMFIADCSAERKIHPRWFSASQHPHISSVHLRKREGESTVHKMAGGAHASGVGNRGIRERIRAREGGAGLPSEVWFIC